MVKKLILAIQKETGTSPYEIMESFVYGAIWGLVIAGSIYPAFWLIAQAAQAVGLR